jgi:glycosyltransferase involved in cell wall biosynthesis
MIKIARPLLSTEQVRRSRLLSGMMRQYYNLKLVMSMKQRWRSNNKYVIVTSGSGPGLILALLQVLLFWEKVPIVMYDCLWHQHHNPFFHYIKKVQLKAALSRVLKCIVWGKSDIDNFVQMFDLPRTKFEFIPFHETLHGQKFSTTEKNYIFSGGTSGRDWDLLIRVARTIDYSFFIATFDERYLDRKDLPPNVRIESVSPHMFRKLMGEGKFHVVPIKRDFNRTFGHQTFLNGMAMGKAVIVADEESAEGYITHMHDGIVTKSGDAHSLAYFINFLLKNDQERKRIGDNARSRMERGEFSYFSCMSKIYNIALEEASNLLKQE